MRYLYELTEEQHARLLRCPGAFEPNGDPAGNLCVWYTTDGNNWQRMEAKRIRGSVDERKAS